MDNTPQYLPFDLSAALRRGQQLLNDRDFSKAQAVYDQILMSFPENAEAFVGQLLCENKCSTLSELTQVWPGLFREEKTATLDDALSEEERAAFPDLDGTYPSRVASAEENRERMERYIDRDYNLKHALEYGSDKLRAALARVRSAVLSAYDSRIESAKRDEEKAIGQVRDRFVARQVAQRLEAVQMEQGGVADLREEPADAEEAALNVLPNPSLYRRKPRAPADPTPEDQTPEEQLPPDEQEKTTEVRRALKLALILSLAAIVLVGAILAVTKLAGKKKNDAVLSTTDAPKATEPTAPEETDPPVSEKEQAYLAAEQLLSDGNKAAAAMAFGRLGDYLDARERSFALWSEIAPRDSIAAGADHTLGLRSDGTVVAVGGNEYGECSVTDWTDIVSVAAGGWFTLGLRSDGTVVAVGNNEHGQCDVSGWRDIVSVSAGEYHTVGLKSDGTVAAAGENEIGRCGVSGWRDIVAVAAGAEHTVGLRSDGTVVAVGTNEDGRCDVSGWRDIVAVAAGADHTLGLRSDGTVVAVGGNEYGECSVTDWTNIVSVAAGGRFTLGLKSDGTVVAAGDNRYGQCGISGRRDIVALAAGYFHAVGLKSDGTVVASGWNEYEQCDASDWTQIKRP